LKLHEVAVILRSDGHFRGDSAAASLKQGVLVCNDQQCGHFRGDSAAASLKPISVDKLHDVDSSYFRGDSAAASLKLNRFLFLFLVFRISAAIPPRPH